MEQNKINAIIIAGIIVVGAGAWAGPVMTAQTANSFLIDLGHIQTAQVGFYQGQGFNFDEFGLGAVKDEIWFFDHDDTFDIDTVSIGPVVELFAFEQQLVPDNNNGIVILTANDGVFDQPHTIIEMQSCGTADQALGGTGAELFDECQPAFLTKVYVQATAGNANDNELIRLQLAVCQDPDGVNNQFSDTAQDNDASNDECDASNTGGDDFTDALIILDIIVQPSKDHITVIDVDAAIPAFQGSMLMARAADETTGGTANTPTIWVAVERVGDQGGFEFLNPGQFGSGFADGCVLFDLETSGTNLAQNAAGIFMDVFGIPFFDQTDTNGRILFNNVPLGSFAIIDLELSNSVLFLDQVIGTSTNNLGFASGCFEIQFDIVDDKPKF